MFRLKQQKFFVCVDNLLENTKRGLRQNFW